MHKDPAEVLGILLHPVIESLDLLLVEEPEDVLLQLARALARDDLDQRGLRPHGLVDDSSQRAVDVLAAVVDVMQVELEFHGRLRVSTSTLPAATPVNSARPARQ